MSTTKRPISEKLEDILGVEFPVLDHGFVRVVDYMGNDSSIVQAARVSYGDGTKTKREDEGLIRYLLRHAHTTPFEMAVIKLHCKMPIFVARQWIRHRTASVNEESARYSILKNEFYVPESEHIAHQSTLNRQGRGELLAPDRAGIVQEILLADSLHAYDNYKFLLEEEDLSRELARMELTLNFYTEWYWECNLHNLMHFLKLRTDPHAQYEIRVYADVILNMVKDWVPMCYRAYIDYVQTSVPLSGPQVEALKKIMGLTGMSVMMPDVAGMSKDEGKELASTFGFDTRIMTVVEKSSV